MSSTQHKAKQFQAIKGVRDILPPESALWNRVEQTARDVFGSFGFAEIRLPIFEQTELFARSIGVETDVVSKEMYSFDDHQVPEPAKLRAVLVTQEPDDGVGFERQVFQIEEFLRLLENGLSQALIKSTP